MEGAAPQGYLSEMFISYQGEAKYQGELHLFIRLSGCPLRCRYCDQPEALGKSKNFRVEKEAHSASFLLSQNPVTPGSLWQILQRYQPRFPEIQAVSVTGGEPLVQAVFLRELFLFLKSAGLRILLETAGIHAERYQKVQDFVDIVSMDIKLPSSSGEQWYLSEHQKFLEAVRASAAECFIKLVIAENSSEEELERVGAMLQKHAPAFPVYLQELWPEHPEDHAPSPETMQRLREVMLRFVPDVYISRQQHKHDGIL